MLYLLLGSLVLACSPERSLRQAGLKDEKCTDILLRMKEKIYRLNDTFYGFRFASTLPAAQKLEYLQFVDEVNYYFSNQHERQFRSLRAEDVIRLLGRPTMPALNVKARSLYYVFDFGVDCPCSQCENIEQRYQNCNSIHFSFTKKGALRKVSMVPAVVGW